MECIICYDKCNDKCNENIEFKKCNDCNILICFNCFDKCYKRRNKCIICRNDINYINFKLKKHIKLNLKYKINNYNKLLNICNNKSLNLKNNNLYYISNRLYSINYDVNNNIFEIDNINKYDNKINNYYNNFDFKNFYKINNNNNYFMGSSFY